MENKEEIISLIKNRLCITVDTIDKKEGKFLVVRLHITDTDSNFVEISSDSISLKELIEK